MHLSSGSDWSSGSVGVFLVCFVGISGVCLFGQVVLFLFIISYVSFYMSINLLFFFTVCCFMIRLINAGFFCCVLAFRCGG